VSDNKLHISVGGVTLVDVDYDELECGQNTAGQNTAGEITLTARSSQLAAEAAARRI
jgi:hypothetical protein